MLRTTYRRALEESERRECRSIAFTSLSTGNRRFPPEKAARIAVDEIRHYLRRAPKDTQVTMVCTDPDTLQAYQQAIKT